MRQKGVRSLVVGLGTLFLVGVLLVSGAAAQILYPRGDADCSARLSAVDLVAGVHGAGGNSVCGNDDCDRNGTVAPTDLTCAAGCLFGDCPVPAGAPRATSVVADSTPRIVPFSVVRVTADHLGSGRSTQVTIGGVEAGIVGQTSPNTLLVVVPDIEPGPADVVIHDGDVAGFPLPIDVQPAVPVGAPDTFAGTLDLYDQVLSRFAALDLAEIYGEDADVVAFQILLLRGELAVERARLAMDMTFTPQLRAQLDAAFEGSGVPEILRQVLDDIDALDALQSGGSAAGVGAGGVAEVDFFTLAGIVSTTTAVIGTVIAAAGAAGLAPALVASALVNGAGFLALEAAGTTAPKIFSIHFFDASGEPAESAAEGGLITVNGARLSATSLVLTTARREIVLSPQVSSASFQQFTMPQGEYGLCGGVVFSVRRNLPPFAESNQIRSAIKPELLQVIGPNPAAPGDTVVLAVRGVAGCDAFARFHGGASPASVPAGYRSNAETGVPVPALLPGQYTVDLRVGISETEPRSLRIISPVTGLEVVCDAAMLRVFPGTPPSTHCSAKPLPRGVRVPIEFQTFRWMSSDTGTAFVTEEAAAHGDGQATVHAEAPGTTAITATLTPLNVTSAPRMLTVTDDTEPTVAVAAAPSVDPGGSIAVAVTARDNVFVSRIVLRATGDAVVNGQQEFPCVQLEKICSAQFTVNVKERDFTRREIIVSADAFDGSGNLGRSEEVIVRVNGTTPGDTLCPQLMIQSPANGSTVNAGDIVTVVALARDNQPGDTGISRFRYSANGDALVAKVGPQDLTQPLLPEATLRFNFQVKSAAALASVTNRAITISVQAFDNAMPPLNCAAQIITVTAGAPPGTCGAFPQPGDLPRCNDPTSRAAIVLQPAQGYYDAPFTITLTITGPAAAQVVSGFARAPNSVFLARQPNGSFQGTERFAATQGSYPVVFLAYDERNNILCCGSTNLMSLGRCTRDSDCGTGQSCDFNGKCG